MAYQTFYGCDVSRWQGVIDWNALNPGASFAFFKGGGGDDGMYVDEQFGNNLVGARSLGNAMPHGIYWFAAMGDPIAEANYFVENCASDLQVGEVLVLDDEEDGSLEPTWAKQWLDQVASLVGFKPLIYLSDSQILAHDWTEVADAGYGVWAADWAVSTDQNVPLKYWPFYAFQQYEDDGHFPGIEGGTGNVDADAFFAEEITDFFSYGKPAVVATPVATPAPTTTPVDPTPPAASVTPVETPPASTVVTPTTPTAGSGTGTGVLNPTPGTVMDVVKPKKGNTMTHDIDDLDAAEVEVTKNEPEIVQTLSDISQVKSGWKTSEFYVTVATDITTLAGGLLPANSVGVKAISALTAGIITIAYIAARVHVKNSAIAK